MHPTRHSKRSLILSLLSLIALVGAVSLSISLLRHPGQAKAAEASRQLQLASIPANIDVSQRLTNESEETVAVNPTNPKNIVIVTNVDHPAAGLFEGVSFDGGATWTTKLIGVDDNLGDACCDPSLSIDPYGNLFLTYLFEAENTVPVALSTDGGLNFNVIANIAAPPKMTGTKAGGRGLFRFVDQPTITAAEDEVWVVFNAGGPMYAIGAPVTGLGQVGSFLTGETVAGSNNCT